MRVRASKSHAPALPAGRRIYAIGDVHGEGGLLRRVLRLIHDDHAARGEAEVTLVFLGDIIDRGPDAAELLRILARTTSDNVVVIKGNHEAALADSYRGDREVLLEWLPFGAASTLAGFGITSRDIDSPVSKFEAALRERIEPDLVEWIEKLPKSWGCGDYYFTHAGIRPGVTLDEQDELDLLWIREPFLSSRRRHGKIIVHGHTVEPGLPPLGGNRIGIDTGAHEHGVLTALGLEGEQQWLLQAHAGRNASAAREGPETSDGQGAPSPIHDIGPLIASIVAPAAQSSTVARPRKMASLSTVLLRSPLGRAKGFDKGGYVATGFALAIAVLGGAAAIWSRQSQPPPPPRPEGTTIAIPAAERAPTALVTLGPKAPKPLVRKSAGVRPSIKPVADAAPLEDPASNLVDTPSPRLYGTALEKALEDDRAVTRRLNSNELSRQRGQTDPSK